MTDTPIKTQQSVSTTVAFVQTLGVNVHMGYVDTIYKDVSLVQAGLEYLGVNNIRDGVPVTTWMHGNEKLAAAGYKIDFIIPTGGGTIDLPASMARLENFAKNYVGSVASIEGPNEVDYAPFAYNGHTDLSSAITFQHDLYGTIKSDPLLPGSPVYNLTLGTPNAMAYAQLGQMSAMADMASIHSYAPYGNAPSYDYANVLAAGKMPVAKKGAVITEAGYSTAPTTLSGVDQTVQAKYSLDLLLDGARDGVSMTYLYELLDEKPDAAGSNIQQHYGLFNNDGTAKLAATAIHNLTTILNTGASVATGTNSTLSYALKNFTKTDSQLLLQKRPGTFDVALWAEPTIWNYKTQSEVAIAPHAVTVTFGKVESHVSIFDPLVGTSAIAQYNNASSVDVSIGDHPVIVEINDGTNALVIAAQPVIASYSTGTCSTAGGVSNAAAITLAGRGTAGTSVSIFDGTTSLGSTIVAANGIWSYTTAKLADGAHGFTAATDQSLASARLALEIDTTAPTTPSLAVYAADATSVGAATNSRFLTLKGVVEANATVTVFDGIRKLGTTVASADGSWSFTTGGLSDGQHALSATATDKALNVSVASVADFVVVDTVAPRAPSIKPMSADGMAAVGGITNRASILVTGTSAAGTKISVFDNGNLIGTTSSVSDGTWSLATGSLSEGSHSLNAVAADAAGNTSVSSRFVGLTTDYTGPTVALATAAQDSSRTTLTGSAEAGAKISILDGGLKLTSVTADKTGKWTATTANGTNNLALKVSATDSAGNLTIANLSALTSGSGSATLVAQNNSLITTSPTTSTTIAISNHFENEVISGFSPRGSMADALQFSKASFTDLSALMAHASQVGADTVISSDSLHSLTLKNVVLSALTTSNVHFT